MMVTFVSQCEKKALNRTRRVLDAFADRIGDNTWQTVITQEGLNAVRKLLRKTASKNTAVSCHWIRSRARSELVWVVGTKAKFNQQGVVPVNLTEQNVDQYFDKNRFKVLPVIHTAASIAALFHDFGKATVLFQKKLNPKEKTESFEPFRHEWVSYRLFQAFVGSQEDDKHWLLKLSEIDSSDFPEFHKDGIDQDTPPQLTDLPPFARLVAWLILTHHKLPVYPGWKADENTPPNIKKLDLNFPALWNSHNCSNVDQKERVDENWDFYDLPVKSAHWRRKACELASKALLDLQSWLDAEINWLDEHSFTTHLSRLSLTLADHYYSSLTLEEAKNQGSLEWRSRNYKVYANTDWVDNQKIYKQQLDEHLTGVAKHAEEIAKELPSLNSSLDSLQPNADILENVGYNETDNEKRKKLKEKFGWQDDARNLTAQIGKDTLKNGFFGISMASTGKGKTRANAKIMTALGLQTGRVRFSVALGLRVLTLQTGREFQTELALSEKDLAIAVGGAAVKQLFENQESKNTRNTRNTEPSHEELGSESADLDTELYTRYSGEEKKHSLSQWTKKQKGLDNLIVAPVLVSTIDHLIRATEGIKGGRQIPATLRLLTSDIVLDEPDDFGLSDLPALCRFVNWAGMLGSRVLLSTATIPPALAYALFQAYQAGWQQYAKANLDSWSGEIICAWFDEKHRKSDSCNSFEKFRKTHDAFVNKRIKDLEVLPAKRWGEILEISQIDEDNIAECMANTIQKATIKLHHAHCLIKNNKTLSIGLVRMANINPMVAVAKYLLKKDIPEKDTCIHYCVYHSRYPLAIRSNIENRLDNLLNRKVSDAIWDREETKRAIESSPNIKNHIFIILASPVAEVGRDHDYDWAIVEPSSMRSIIQLAGRILRHRDEVAESANLLLLQKNYKALVKEKICFIRPGFESDELHKDHKMNKHFKLALSKHSLSDVLDVAQYKRITAIQRITLPKQYKTVCVLEDNKAIEKYTNLVELEHKSLAHCLLSGEKSASIWWKSSPHWCGEVQRQQRFRDSKKDEPYYLCLDSQDKPYWKWKNENVSPAEWSCEQSKIEKLSDDITIGAGNHFLFDLSAESVYSELANDMSMSLTEISELFGEVRLVEYEENDEVYSYNPQLGVYKEVE